MVMVPDRYIYFINILKDLVQTNEVSMNRIDDAVRRILKQKFLMRLFEEPYTDRSLLPGVGSTAHRNVAQQAVRESLVLLASKNDVLPLSKTEQKILVLAGLQITSADNAVDGAFPGKAQKAILQRERLFWKGCSNWQPQGKLFILNQEHKPGSGRSCCCYW